jgi:hypothetical protein
MGGRLEKVELDNGTRKRYPDSTPPSGEKEDTSCTSMYDVVAEESSAATTVTMTTKVSSSRDSRIP